MDLTRTSAGKAGPAAPGVGFDAVATAAVADDQTLYLVRQGGAHACLLEGYSKLGLQILARLAPHGGPVAASKPRAKHRGKDVEDVAGEPHSCGVGTAEAVEAVAPLGVGEHRVGLVDLLEALFCLGVARVAVGVVSERKLAVGRLYRLLAGAPVDSEHLVVVTHQGNSIREKIRKAV